MRRAIAELVDKGLLVRKRGVGTQVVHGLITRPVELSSLFEDLRDQYRGPSTVVLINETSTTTTGVAARLSISPGTPVLHLRRLRLAEGEPLAILENYLPEDLIGIGDTDLTACGLYQRIRARGVRIRVAKQRIGARRPHPKNPPCWTSERVSRCSPWNAPPTTKPAAPWNGASMPTAPAATPSK
jgi:DNA-binding GntR family transcriptional regulator